METDNKSREQIKAEREARKKLKQTGKKKADLQKNTANMKDCGCFLFGSPTNTAATPAEPIESEKRSKTSNKQTQNNVVETVDKGNILNNSKNIESQVEIINKNLQKTKLVSTKAERRALQESQRLAKANAISVQGQNTKPNAAIVPKADEGKKVVKIIPEAKKDTTSSQATERKVKLFNHLDYKYMDPKDIAINSPLIHPAILKLGEQYSKRIVVGSNARCIAFLNALKLVVKDYETPPKKEFARGLDLTVQRCVDYIQKCRPLAVSVINVHKTFKCVLTQLGTDRPDSELKEYIFSFIDTYIRDQIEKAAEAISNTVQTKISDGDIILTFGCSSLIYRSLEEAHRRKVRFRVITVDSRPFLEGQELLRRLVLEGISCECVSINAIGFVMPEVSKVLLGAHAILANGYVMARTGTAQIALVSRSFNVPVLVCCETHKFSERVQTDAIVYNELEKPDALLNIKTDHRLENWHSLKKFCPLNINYDVTPPELITAVITEVAFLPCTSVPVILRIKPTEIVY